jgi:hypothetical protein
MTNKRHKPEEIVTKLRQVEVLRGQGMTLADAIRQIGVSELTYYRWRKKCGGMEVSNARKLQGARGREPAAEEAAGGVDAGCVDLPHSGIDPDQQGRPAAGTPPEHQGHPH